MTNNKQTLIIGILLIVVTINLIQAQTFGDFIPSSFTGDNYRVFGASINPQFTQPGFYGGYGINPRDYWLDFNTSDCRQRQDVILTIPPGGCSPTVVRSDLLEERNVPVFCKVSSIQINPLIDVSKIRSIYFKKGEAKGAQVSYFPARAAVRSGSRVEPSPIVDNVGYLVITLPRYKTEAEMPEWVSGNVTAVIDYDSEGVFGVGEHDFYLDVMDDEEWERSYKENGFWKGKGFIRLESVDETSARVSIYRDGVWRESTVSLKQGEVSNDIYLDGYYCAAGMNIKLDDISYPVDTALLKVDDEDVWVARGSSFLNGKCKVRSVDVGEVGGGVVSFSCPGTGSVRLMLGGAEVNLKVDNKDKKVSSGGFVKNSKGKNIYLGYVGKSPEEESNFVVLIKTSDNEESFTAKGIGTIAHSATERYSKSPNWLKELKTTSKISLSNVWDQIERLNNNEDRWLIGDEGEFYSYLIYEINSRHGEIGLENIKILKTNHNTWSNENITLEGIVLEEDVLENTDLKEYYDLAIENYDNVFELYPNEKPGPNEKNSLEPYGAQALYNAGELSGILGLRGEQIKYAEKLIENYPDSYLVSEAEKMIKEANKGKVTEESQAIVYINNEPHFISLRDFKEPSYEDLGAEIVINEIGKKDGSKTFYFKKDELQKTHISGLGIIVEEIKEGKGIKEDFVEIRYFPDDKFYDVVINSVDYYLGKKAVIEVGKTEQLTPDISIKLVDINLEKQAKIKIIPKTFGMRTESDLSFKVGIEKRGIKLSPEKTQEMIDNLAETIKKWDDINKKLGNVVRGLKGACFATSAMLTITNLINGRNGESMARNDVMTSEGGWNEKCRLAVSDGKYSSVPKCLLEMDKKGYIKADIDVLQKQIKARNDAIKEIQNKVGVSDEGFLTKSYDINKIEDAYRESDDFKNVYNSNIGITIKGREGETKLQDIISETQLDKLDIEEMKEITTYGNILKSELSEDSALRDIAKKKLGEVLYGVDNRLSITREIDGLKDAFKTSGITAVAGSNKKTKVQEMNSVDGPKVGLGSSTQAFLLSIPDNENFELKGQKIKVGLKLEGGVYQVEKAINSKDTDVTKEVKKYYNSIGGFTKVSPEYYNNAFKEQPKVKYYTRAPYQKLPAQVPIGKVGQTNGWYVGTDYILSGFGRPYEESGRAVNFWICNVGENGLVNFKQGDECRYYNRGTSQDLKFSGLSVSESARLVQKAETAIREASRQHGKKEVVILGKKYKTDIAENGESGECSDFMSPKDCNLMFNVCDPVLCPESRCDFGGQYRVANVVQSGIIGSLLLCLPNMKEGIAVPVCLTGVNAGIDGYLSILKSTQGCLQESLDTGRNIGICDEIKSVYMCDFFWRQAVPLMDVFIPRVFEAFLGQGVRGGGEYLTVDYAWENMKNSVDYFKNEYAVNSMKAFNSRSTAEIGGEVCKSFIGTRYPASKDFFDKLVEPDSPVQYNAWFSENILTEATIPSTSHYKVYYHIYAGKDIGANYVVYLKNPPESSYVNTLSTYVVDRGYIRTGEQVDRARDFTSVAGYQELCVNINGQEECGFKQVSTSWAMNELSRRYVEEQVTEGSITTSEECVSGSPSLWSVAQPNLQAGAQEALNPELYKRGIIRVCSSNNPGAGVEASGELDKTNSTYDRWKKVGDCDSASIGCWLDTNSVKDVLRDAPNLSARVLNDVDLGYLGEVKDMMPGDVGKVFEGIPKDKSGRNFKLELISDNLKKENIDKKIEEHIKGLKEVSERGVDKKGYTNGVRVKAFLWIGKIYDEITKKLYYRISKLAKREGNEEAQNNIENNLGKSKILYDDSDSDVNKNDLFKLDDYYLIYDKGWKYKKELSDEEWKEIDINPLMSLKSMNFNQGVKELAERTTIFYKDYKFSLNSSKGEESSEDGEEKTNIYFDEIGDSWIHSSFSPEIVIEYDDGTRLYKNYFYKFDRSEWVVSKGNDYEWKDISEMISGWSKLLLNGGNDKFMRSLQKENSYKGGLMNLILRTIDDNDGTLIVYTRGNEIKKYKSGDPRLIELGKKVKNY